MTGPRLLTFYGDDFTGSTDAMEALSANGVPTVLFTRIPSDTELNAFAWARAIGLAGESRSRSPAWMDEHLPETFRWLGGLGARICHYKVCSTFDSSPEVGSIGRATEIGLEVFGQSAACMVVGAPQLRRYTMFGQLFAAYLDQVWRIDRHPVMSRHPATPMDEADLGLHIARQTTLQFGCVHPDMLRTADPAEALRARLDKGDRIVLIDVYDTGSQRGAGDLLEAARPMTGPFVVGSSGVEYALLRAWQAAGTTMPPDETPALPPTEATAIVSGSCSPTTERQIREALASGFAGIAVDYPALAGGQGFEAAERAALHRARAALKAGRSPLLYTALGPGSVQNAGGSDAAGRALGRMLRVLMDEYPLTRVAVAGGDTSSHALFELDVLALTLRRPIPQFPGSPVCNAHPATARPPFEIALKGGQVGREDYFVRLRDGE